MLLLIILSNTAIAGHWYFSRPENVTSINKDGVEIPIIKGAVNGRLERVNLKDDARMEFYGWAFDVRNSRIADAILLRYNGENLYWGKNNQDRPDLVNVFGKNALKGGFKLTVPLDFLENKQIENSKLRLFAVSSGASSELKYFKGFK